MTACLFLFLAFVVSSGEVCAQSGDDEAFFRRGVLLFKQKKYVSSSLDFKEIINTYPSSIWALPSYMFLSKALFQLGDYTNAELTADEFHKKYPKSSYADWALYFIAACKMKTGDTRQAAEILARLAYKTSDDSLRIRSLRALKYSVMPVITADEVTPILEKNGITQVDLDSVEPYVVTETEFSSIEAEPDSGSYVAPKRWEGGATFKIGLIAPLTGANSDLGLQLLKGVQTTFELEANAGEPKLELIIDDTESDPVTAVLATRKLIHEGVIAIIGPVLSETTIVAAVESQANGILFVAPTSQSNGLTRLGKYIFQVNFNPVIQAEALADFAHSTLKAANYAIIASNDWWGESVTQSFIKRMDKNGAVNVWSEYINSSIPISEQTIIMNIMEHAPESHALKDSLIVVDYGNAFPDSIFIRRDLMLRGDKQLPQVNSIDCILISAASEDVIQLAGQLVENNIDTVVLGDSGWWINVSAFEGGEEYIEGAYIVAPLGELSGGLGLTYFHDSPRFSETHDIPLMRGADACKLLIHCLKNGARSPDALITMLESVRDFQGVSSLITIDPERHVNTAVDFVRVRQGRYVRVEKDKRESSTDVPHESNAQSPAPSGVSVPANP